jgi:aspartyl-tRNA(Asn)/glutamyl-tRNA(Gln) amidotransferase subunit C
MTITREEILHTAELARLELDDAAVIRYAGQIGEILEHVATLAKIDTDGVSPTAHAIDMTNAFREDVPKSHLDTEKTLQNAPQSEDGFFLVPKVVG